MIKKQFITWVFALITLFSFAQIENPVTWSFDTKEIGNNKFELTLTANIEENWHMYSQHLPSDEGPIATTFSFEKNDAFQLIGDVKEPEPHKQYDPNFEMELSFFDNEVVFRQIVELKTTSYTVKGEVEFMVCDDSKCLPPDAIPFEFQLTTTANEPENNVEIIESNPENPFSSSQKETSQILTPVKWKFETEELGNNEYNLILTAKIEKNWHLYSQNIAGDGPVPTSFAFETSKNYELIGKTEEKGESKTNYDPNFDMELTYFENEAIFTQKVKLIGKGAKIKGTLTFMTCDDTKCLPPDDIPFELEVGEKEVGSTTIEKKPTEHSSKSESKGLISIFFWAFLSGFAALLTPCVFPMIPMTVSFFTKQSKSKAAGIKNALFYGISIIVIYVILGTVVTAVFGSDALNALSTNVYFNILFFVLLVVFAISFLGAFEITLPSSWVNKADKASDKGGLIGIFFMATTLALVSFSCTGPIVGTLLVEAASIGGAGPVVGMLGFSTALALPFGLFAAFPGWMNSLPQSGGWLNTVKVFLGFLELALAFKFLSNADLVVQAHYLEREMFLAIWIGIFAVLAMYLFGFIQLPHDSPMQYLSVGRALLGTIVVIFVIYLIPGLWGAPLQLISGFPPPMSYSESPSGLGGGGAVAHSTIEGTHVGEHGLLIFNDLDKGVAYAKTVNKPVMLDFTGHACVNCRKMEQNVWGESGVIEKLRNDVVIISLYVDDKRLLPENEQIEVKIGNRTKLLKTIGNKWSYYQADRYKINTQPYYRMLGSNGEDLANGSADYEHHGNATDFEAWLKEGIELYKK